MASHLFQIPLTPANSWYNNFANTHRKTPLTGLNQITSITKTHNFLQKNQQANPSHPKGSIATRNQTSWARLQGPIASGSQGKRAAVGQALGFCVTTDLQRFVAYGRQSFI
jgi:hypothetical protein